jgi:ketosteroid isomerase-like protein
MPRTFIPFALALGLAATPVLAEQGTGTVSQQEARQAADLIAKKFETFYNAGDAAGIAKLFTDDGTYVAPNGMVLTDHQMMEKAVSGRIKAGWTKETIKVMEAHPAGEDVWLLGEYTILGTAENDGKQIGGYFTDVLTRKANDWYIRLLIANLKPVQDVTGMASQTSSGVTPPK